MNQFGRISLIPVGFVLFLIQIGIADNPLILDQFTADPTARVFEGKIYVYPSHDIPVPPGSGARQDWFCMEDYHVFSSENLIDWTDHGVILTQSEVPWLTRMSYSMWAPDCVFRDGKYYFYFPTGGRIGVAIADNPYGPFKPEPTFIQGIRGIDPGVIIDKDGIAYLFYSDLMVAKLKENMVEIEGPPQQIANLPKKGLREGPFPFVRNGIYYLTYPHVQNNTERIEYAMASSPMGPYEWKGVIMDESASGCWTNHHSILEYKGQWYLFYHDMDLSPNFDKNRAIKADYLYFNEDGTIQKVIPTVRGIGNAPATNMIQIDRYSAKSETGAAVEYLNPEKTFDGWKTVLSAPDAWIRYDRVDFAGKTVKTLKVRAMSATGGSIEVQIGKDDAAIKVPVVIAKCTDWTIASSNVSAAPSGLQDIKVVLKGDDRVEIDWIQFE
ncbi:MAG: family 43 glycosylhydrolase [Phycisphaerae bacterium]|nr:family 43 glycosylhydrolase [Phycisphaerae bacterium]